VTTLINTVLWITLMGGRDTTPTCDELATSLQASLERSAMAMEPESNLAWIYATASDAGTRCSENESVAYLQLRAAELGAGASVGRQPAPASNGWRTMAPSFAVRFPRSVRIAAIRARASGTVADARGALNLDPEYLPARVALAAALLPTDPAQAATYLSPGAKLGVVSDGYTVLARVRWALHDVDGAIQAANLALHGRSMHLIEPDGRDPRPLSGAHEILGRAFLEKREYAKAATHLKLASADSEAARAILADPPSGLRRALRSTHPGAGTGFGKSGPRRR
jgi:hypothetical protein